MLSQVGWREGRLMGLLSWCPSGSDRGARGACYDNPNAVSRVLGVGSMPAGATWWWQLHWV